MFELLLALLLRFGLLWYFNDLFLFSLWSKASGSLSPTGRMISSLVPCFHVQALLQERLAQTAVVVFKQEEGHCLLFKKQLMCSNREILRSEEETVLRASLDSHKLQSLAAWGSPLSNSG